MHTHTHTGTSTHTYRHTHTHTHTQTHIHTQTHTQTQTHTDLQVAQASHPGACVSSVVLEHQVHQLPVDLLAGDGGQVALGETALAEKLLRYRERMSGMTSC